MGGMTTCSLMRQVHRQKGDIMRKSHLKRLKKDAEEAYQDRANVARQPQVIQDRFEVLPERITEAQERLDGIRTRLADAKGKLTKPLMHYAHERDWRTEWLDFGSEKAQVVYDLERNVEYAQQRLHELREEYDAGSEGKLAEAQEAIEEARRAFDVASTALCQYAVFYARQRRDIDLAWTSEDEGQWTLDGTVAGRFDGKARKITMKALILYLIEPHSHRNDAETDEEDFNRTVMAHKESRDEYMIIAKNLYKAMTGLPTNSYVDIAGCTVQVRRMREYLRLCGDILRIKLPAPDVEVNDGAECTWGYREKIHTTARPDGLLSHRATWKHILKVPEAHIALAA
jgi:hypothetical protein